MKKILIAVLCLVLFACASTGTNEAVQPVVSEQIVESEELSVDNFYTNFIMINKTLVEGNVQFAYVTYCGGKFFLGAPEGRMWYSEDCENWIEIKQDVLKGRIDCIYYVNERFFAIDNMDGFAYSNNGINWNTIERPQFSPRSVTYNGNRFVGVGVNYNRETRVLKEIFASSDDGTNWTEICEDTHRFSNIVYDGSKKYMAKSDLDNKLWYSDNLINWTEVILPEHNVWRGVLTFGDGKFITIFDRSITYSSDGILWELKDSSINEVPFRICFGNNKILATYGARIMGYFE